MLTPTSPSSDAGMQVVEMVRKLALIGISSSLAPGSLGQSTYGLLVCFFFFGFISSLSPYEDATENRLALTCQLMIFVYRPCVSNTGPGSEYLRGPSSSPALSSLKWSPVRDLPLEGCLYLRLCYVRTEAMRRATGWM